MNWIGDQTHKDKEAEQAAKPKDKKLNSELSRFGFQIEQLTPDEDNILPYPYSRIGMLGIYAEDVQEAADIFKQYLKDIARLAKEEGIDIEQLMNLGVIEDQD